MAGFYPLGANVGGLPQTCDHQGYHELSACDAVSRENLIESYNTPYFETHVYVPSMGRGSSPFSYTIPLMWSMECKQHFDLCELLL